MAAFKSVFDFLKAVPAALNHEQIYRSKVESANDQADTEIDMSVWEASTVSLAEMNVLRDLEIPDKFTRPGLDTGFEMSIASLAKQRSGDIGKGSLTSEKVTNETFTSTRPIFLDALGLDMCTSTEEGLQVPNNLPRYKELVSTLATMAVGNMTGINMSYVGERMVLKSDMRHIFLKGYLMLMGYNLGITSVCQEYDSDTIRIKMLTSVTPIKKMELLTKHRVPVDLDRLTPEEVWLLAEIGGSFPSRRYGGDNIYNSLELGADDVVFFTSAEEYELGEDPGLGSPERLWFDLVSIATKCNALEDLREVVKSFRGVPFLLKTICEYTERDSFRLNYPLSHTLFLGIGAVHIRMPHVKKYSGYYSTAKCLVSDLVLGEMYCMSAYNLMEEMGALGMVGCPSGNAKTDVYFDSNLVELGLKQSNEKSNSLLQEWGGMRGTGMPVEFGGCLKKFVQMFCYDVRRSEAEVLRPHLLHLMPFSHQRNTTWATVRRWKFPEFNFHSTGEQREAENQMRKAYNWVMGVSPTPPKVGRNTFGVKGLSVLSPEELKFSQLAAGEYEITLVRSTIVGELGPRLDEFELTSRAFYSSAFPGVRCTVIFNTGGELELHLDEKYPDIGNSGSLGLDPQDDGYIRTVGGSDVPEMRMSETGMVGGNTSKAGGSGHVGQIPIVTVEPPDSGRWESGEPNIPILPPVVHAGDVPPKLPPVIYASGTDECNSDDVVVTKDKPRTTDEFSNKYEVARREGEVLLGVRDPLRLDLHPNIITVGGTVKTKPVYTHKGEKLELAKTVETRAVRGPVIKGHILQTPGDGHCGAHAVAKDLDLRNISKVTPSELVNIIARNMISPQWYSTAELGAYLNAHGVGLVTVDGVEKSICEIGTDQAKHIVHLYKSGDHFSTFIPDDGGEVIGTDFKRAYQQPYMPTSSFRQSRKMLRELESSVSGARKMEDLYDVCIYQPNVQNYIQRQRVIRNPPPKVGSQNINIGRGGGDASHRARGSRGGRTGGRGGYTVPNVMLNRLPPVTGPSRWYTGGIPEVDKNVWDAQNKDTSMIGQSAFGVSEAGPSNLVGSSTKGPGIGRVEDLNVAGVYDQWHMEVGEGVKEPVGVDTRSQWNENR